MRGSCVQQLFVLTINWIGLGFFKPSVQTNVLVAQQTPQASLQGSRLQRVLGRLAMSNVEVSHQLFTQRLGQLIDLSNSVHISRAHTQGSTGVDASAPESKEAVTANFLQVRNAIVNSIIVSFAPDEGPRRIRFPQPNPQPPADETSGFEPYQRFYQAHQREMEVKIQSLLAQTRKACRGGSNDLAQLVALDVALGDVLAGHSRRFFATIPELLSRRYAHLYRQYIAPFDDSDDRLSGWCFMQEQLGHDIQSVLLAEVEARLLPAQGLIEALHSEIENTHHE